MTRLIAGYRLGKILADMGVLPDECADVEMLIPVDGVLRLRYTVNVTQEDARKLAEAFEKLSHE